MLVDQASGKGFGSPDVMLVRMISIDASDERRRSKRVPARAVEFADNFDPFRAEDLTQAPVEESAKKGESGRREDEESSLSRRKAFGQAEDFLGMSPEVDSRAQANQVRRCRSLGRPLLGRDDVGTDHPSHGLGDSQCVVVVNRFTNDCRWISRHVDQGFPRVTKEFDG